MLPVLSLLLLFMGTGYAEDCPQMLQVVELAPDYTDNIPQGDLQLVYDSRHRAECGNSLSILVTTDEPLVTVDVGDKCDNVSIIAFDPDVPVINEIFLHWFVSNIPASVMTDGYSGQVGDVWATYYGPLGFTGDHRYTFCVYCQTRYISDHRTYEGIPPRMGIDPRSLVAESDLQPPEACNFFYAVATEHPRLGK